MTKSPNDMLGMRVDGYKEGFADCKAAVLDHLEATYLGVEEAKSDEGKAVLRLARELATAMRQPEFGKSRREGKESHTQ